MYCFLCFFYVYAFLGWCAEVAYAALLRGRFVNRGFLNGPVCPIYGFGVLLVLCLLRPLQPYWPLLFLGSVLLASLLELATGVALEKIFGLRWWDYSEEPFNLRGYVCLRFSLLWGFACVFVVDILHPTVSLFAALLPLPLGVVLLVICTVSVAIDLTATVRTIANLRRRQSQIDALAARMRELSDEFGESLSVRVLDAVEVGNELKEDLSERAETFRQEAQQRAEAFREQAEERAERIRNARWEAAELRTRLAQLRAKPVAGQRRLSRAFPNIREQLKP